MATHRQSPRLSPDPIDSAAIAGLQYVCETCTGYTRRRAGSGFCYLDPHGRTIRDRNILKRIYSLAIPPAWKKVWICSAENGHVQAIGYDARGRRQYRYHARYREIRDQTKFARMPDFAKCLPVIRCRVTEDLGRPGLPREKVLATVVRLLETTFIRVGNNEYARDNESFGLTTLRNRHVDIEGSTIRFRFRGKSGVEHEVEVKDRRLARIVRECHDLPGYHLFEYVDEDGTVRGIGSGDVNSYLKTVTGREFTAKDFRTWAGTVQTALQLAAIGGFESATEAKRNVVEAIKATAKRLGNRPATCRRYYVHPGIVDSYLAGTLARRVQPATPGIDIEDEKLHPEEACVLRLIQEFTGSSVKAA